MPIVGSDVTCTTTRHANCLGPRRRALPCDKTGPSLRPPDQKSITDVVFLDSQCTRFIIVSDNSCAQEVNVFGDGQMFGAGSVQLTVRSRIHWLDDGRGAGRENKTTIKLPYRLPVCEHMCAYIYIYIYIHFYLCMTYHRDLVCCTIGRKQEVTCSTWEKLAKSFGTCTRKTRGTAKRVYV